MMLRNTLLVAFIAFAVVRIDAQNSCKYATNCNDEDGRLVTIDCAKGESCKCVGSDEAGADNTVKCTDLTFDPALNTLTFDNFAHANCKTACENVADCAFYRFRTKPGMDAVKSCYLMSTTM